MERFSTLFSFLSNALILAIYQNLFNTSETAFGSDFMRRKLDEYVEENGGYDIPKLDKIIQRVLGIEFTYCNFYGLQREKNWEYNLYNVGIKINGQVYETTYRMGLAHTKPPQEMQVFDSLLCDAECVEYTDNIDDFYSEFGYESVTEAQNAFSACNTVNRFLKMVLS